MNIIGKAIKAINPNAHYKFTEEDINSIEGRIFFTFLSIYLFALSTVILVINIQLFTAPAFAKENKFIITNILLIRIAFNINKYFTLGINILNIAILYFIFLFRPF